MANEIKLDVRLQINNGALKFLFAPGTVSLTQNAIGGPTPGYISVGITEESVAFSELGTEGFVVLHNVDPTNYIQWGFATGVYGGRIKATEPAIFRLEPSATLYLKANTAACGLNIYAFED